MDTSFLQADEIEEIHVEPTSKCQLLCPQCGRAPHGKLNPSLPLEQLNLEAFYRLFTPKFCKQLKHVYFCGNFGDPNMYPHLLKTLQYLKDNGVAMLKIFTNGNAHAPEWWQELAKILNRSRDSVVFAIDGLADTNHLYRVNSRWENVSQNCKAFIRAGGRARWEYLIFEHNKHQIKDAFKLAIDWGFAEFKLKKTNRFNQGYWHMLNVFNNMQHVHKRSSQIDTPSLVHTVQMAKEQEINDRAMYDKLVESHGGILNYFQETPVTCKYKSVKSIFLDFQGRVWPCCWVGAPKYLSDRLSHTVVEHEDFIQKRWGVTFNSLAHHDLPEILNHEWFREKLALSWHAPNSENPRLGVCGVNCGDKLEFSSGFRKSKNAVSFDLTQPMDLSFMDAAFDKVLQA